MAFVVLVATTFFLDRQNRGDLRQARSQATNTAEQEASTLSEALSSEMASRIGALAAAKLQFTGVQDSLSQQTFLEAVDSVIGGVSGLSAITVIMEDGRVAPSSGALLFRTWREPLTIPAVSAAYGKALATGAPAATGVVQLLGGGRILVFDPIPSSDDSGAVRAVLAAELEPLPIVRAALEQERSRLRPAFYALYDPEGVRVTTVPAPEGWDQVTRPVRVGDREWTLAVAHPPVSARSFEMVSGVIRISGLLLALGFAASLFLLWRTVAAQQAEIQRRIDAERQAAESAAEAARRAEEARTLSDQLASAQETALRLSGSLAPENVMDEFLGAVGEVVGADLALLYGFDEDGDQVVGRHRIVLDPSAVPTESPEDFRAVRVPVALLGDLAEPIATGEPLLVRSEEGEGQPTGDLGLTRPRATLAVPLSVAGHLVGLAVWQSFKADGLSPTSLPFARTVAAHAAANLRAAELLEGVRRARGKATREATRLATVLERLADGVVLFDRNGRPERVNAAAQALLGPGMSQARLNEWPVHFLRQGQSSRTLADEPFPLLSALEGRRVDRYRFTIRQQGLERYLAASAAPILDEEKDVRGVAVVVRDVTDEHEYAEILRHTNDELREQATLLERANDELTTATLAKDQFLAMMSHELRTPINAIIGYADLLEIGVHGPLAPKQKHMVNRVVETSRHLLGLVNDVLDLTKIAAGRLDLTLGPVILRPVLLRAANQVSPLGDSKGLTLRVDAPEEVVVEADETRLAQVLINLAANAVKFTEAGSVTLTYETTGSSAIIHVQDTGPGIPGEELERIFEEFHQVDAGHARRAGGTGLGLAISRRLARLMGGDLRVHSRLGEGTDFMLELPLAAEDAAREAVAASRADRA